MSSILDAVSKDAARSGAIPGTPGGGAPYPSQPSGGGGSGRFRSAVLVVVFGVALGALAARMFGGDPGGDDLLTEKAVKPVEVASAVEPAEPAVAAAEPARRATSREGGPPGKTGKREEASARLAAKRKDAAVTAAATPPAPKPLVIPAPPASAGAPAIDAKPPTAPSPVVSVPSPLPPTDAPPVEAAPAADSPVVSAPGPAADAPQVDADAAPVNAPVELAVEAPVEAAPPAVASPVVSPMVPVAPPGPPAAATIVAGTPAVPPTPGVAPASPPAPGPGPQPASPTPGLAPASPTSPSVIAGVPAVAPIVGGTAPAVAGDAEAEVLPGATLEAALASDTGDAPDPSAVGEVVGTEEAAAEVAPADVVYDQRPSGAPEVSILFVAWSRTPGDRMASMRVGSGTLSVVHEGEYVEGLQVSVIHPESVDFQWTGRKFRVPVQPF